MRAAIYARYSSDRQRAASIDDQIRVCQFRIEREGWRNIENFSDNAYSGASLMRPGVQSLLCAAKAGMFDILITESLDRLSRDQEDMAAIFKRLSFAGIQIFTLSDGLINELHIGLKGTMSALFLKDLAEKTRRGMRGCIASGKAAGGISYGYRMLRQIDERGELVRGDRRIEVHEARIVRRIFRQYAEGRSGRQIADSLNQGGTLAPRKGLWQHTTILGNRKRGSGILNNALYNGEIIWNRQRWVKSPYTGLRVSRMNNPEDWVTKDVPDLRIVGQRLWKAVKARQLLT